MAELEVCVEKLESGELSLDESLCEFEKAVKLVNTCNEKLENAKQKIEILLADKDGNIIWIPGIKKSKFDKANNENYDIILWYN